MACRSRYRVPLVSGSIGVGLAERGGVGTEGAVDEQVPRQAAETEFANEVEGGGVGERSPVGHDLGKAGFGRDLQQGPQVFLAGDDGSRAFVDADDAGRGGGPQEGALRPFPLFGGDRGVRGGADEVVGIAGERPVG